MDNKIRNVELLKATGKRDICIISYQLSETHNNRLLKKALESYGFHVRFAGNMNGLMRRFVSYKLSDRLSFRRRLVRRIRFALIGLKRALADRAKKGRAEIFLLVHYGITGDGWLHEAAQIRLKEKGLQDSLFFYDMAGHTLMKYDKPVLGYMEYNAAWHCNLKCKGCSHLSNLVREPAWGDAECFGRNLLRVRELFAHVEDLRIVGGEPFLNPEVDRLVSTVRSVFPDAMITVVSNGLLVPRLKDDVLEAVRESGAQVYISAYPPTIKKKDEITEKLRSHGVKYKFSQPIHEFQYEVGESAGDGKDNYAHCALMHCHLLNDDGKISMCCVPTVYHKNRQWLETQREISEDNWTDLTKETDGYEVLRKMHQPIPFCRYCITRKKIMFPWQGGYTREVRESEFR